MKVLRITRHAATIDQLTELRQAFGQDVEIKDRDITVQDVGELLELTVAEGADAVEVVLPLEKVAEVMEVLDIPVLRAVMIRDRPEAIAGHPSFTFSHYEAYQEVKIKTIRLDGFKLPNMDDDEEFQKEMAELDYQMGRALHS